MGPQTRRILQEYWDTLRMVAHIGGYYGEVFKVFRGLMQGDPLSPTILYALMDAVVQQ